METSKEEPMLGYRELFQEYVSGKANDTHRYESFDLCYHHFRTKFRDSEKKVIDPEKSCAILSAFLASWGMMRASSFLMQNNYRILHPVIDYISGLDASCWEIDVDNYPENYERILEIYSEIKKKFVPKSSQARTLVTKIMLGVFGMVPAFDENFTTFMREQPTSTCRFRSFSRDTLESIHNFYVKHKELLDELNKDERVRVVDFDRNPTNLRYSTAKIIDMIGFSGGKNPREKKIRS